MEELLDINESAFQNLRMTAEEKQFLLDKLEREMDARIQKLKQQAEELAKDLNARCEREINNLPKEIRQLPLDEFINLYHSDPAEYFEKQRTTYDVQITPVIKLNNKRTWASRYLNKKNDIDQVELNEQAMCEGLPKKRTNRDIIRPIAVNQELSADKNARSNSRAKFTRLYEAYKSHSGITRSRYPEPGERIVSLRGTPILNPFSTFKKSNDENKDNPFIVGNKGMVPLYTPSKSFVIPLEDGKFIESPSQIQDMTCEKKEEVRNKINLLQEKLNKFSSVLDK
ncbi:hypothetical protein C1645_737255 [Glomus cerebriforme]|uniref:Borealin N-terminal domain-containing protein n=1 Tax=Glomus cerebriforme TaxID=658196 RepID=A0A397SZA2_9GLOM|nr:hypothetical protein C1645_737255 [Glomus cerebriforme]